MKPIHLVITNYAGKVTTLPNGVVMLKVQYVIIDMWSFALILNQNCCSLIDHEQILIQLFCVRAKRNLSAAAWPQKLGYGSSVGLG